MSIKKVEPNPWVLAEATAGEPRTQCASEAMQIKGIVHKANPRIYTLGKMCVDINTEILYNKVNIIY